MGAQQSKKHQKPMNKIQLEIICDKIYQYLLIHRGRKIDQLAIKERTVKTQLSQAGRIYGDCLFDVSSIVNLMNWIIASKIIMRYVHFLKERSIQITNAANQNNPSKIVPLMTYIQSVIWSMDRLNLKQIKEFTALIMRYFGPESIRQARDGVGVDTDLLNCFKFVEPSPKQVGDYLRQLVSRYKFDDIDVDNQVPPKFRKEPPAPSPAPSPQPPQPPSNNQGGGNGDQTFNPNAFPSTGFFDNPQNLAGQKNWNGLMSGQFQNQNPQMGIKMPDMSKLAPGESQQPGRPAPVKVQSAKTDQSNPPLNEYDIDNMLNQLNEANTRKEGNQPLNPCMSHIKTNKVSGLPGADVKQDEEDFDALMASLQHGIGETPKPEYVVPEPEKQPKMRGAPTRRNKAKKPIPNEPEAYKYSNEMDKDTEEKYYEELSLEFRIEEMRRLQV